MGGSDDPSKKSRETSSKNLKKYWTAEQKINQRNKIIDRNKTSEARKISREVAKNKTLEHNIAFREGTKKYAKNKSKKHIESLKMQLECPHCQKVGKAAGMRVHHFNNCKYVLLQKP
jgi:hypothetical protein